MVVLKDLLKHGLVTLASEYIPSASESMVNCIFIYTSLLTGYLVHASDAIKRPEFVK